MNVIGKLIAGLALCLIGTTAGIAEEPQTRNCTWCHGAEGQGYSHAPRIAGQRPDYLVKQLMGFKSHERDEYLNVKYMWAAAAHLDAETARALANYFAALPAEAAKDGDPSLVGEGKAIFENGIPEANIAACQACHGPQAQGVREIPRLGGLSYSYLSRRLGEFYESHSEWGTPMPKVARSLSPAQISAIASFLSFVEVQTATK